MKRQMVGLLAAISVAACSETPAVDMAEAAEAAAPATADIALPPLPELFDCLRKSGGVVVAAHRGGGAAGYPENAIETMAFGLAQGIRVFEVDVATSREGVLFLHHDDRFGRTSDADGYVSDTAWREIAAIRLRDIDGQLTDFHPPKLTDALIWAKQNGAILELDRKKTTSFREIAAAVKAAGAEANAIMISYSDEEAAEIAKIDPALMMTASARGGRDVAALEALGVDRTRIIAWTGTQRPDPPAFERLVKEGVEPAFGTLGRKGERLDDEYWADGNGIEYQHLVDDGVVLIATDEPYRVAEWLDADDAGWAACVK